MSYIKLKRTLFVLSLYLMTLSACDRNDGNSSIESANLSFTADNLEGDWKRTAQYIGQINDSLGVLVPKEDSFAQFEYCRKDDIIRYIKGNQQEENVYFWGIGEIACHSQIANSFLEIGTWDLNESGKLTHSYLDVNEPFMVVKLRSQQLQVRRESGVESAEGTIYEFTEYIRAR
ncbi:hypothetical protein AB8P51_11240 [Muriicola sp. SD30]|uniref:hypothetical protein n=1 Tax=Muriicola sp. SD30 TaxID=3240936 RepID=UPI00350EB4DB